MLVQVWANRATRDGIREARRRGVRMEKMNEDDGALAERYRPVDCRILLMIQEFIHGIEFLPKDGPPIVVAARIMLYDGLANLIDFANGLGVEIEYYDSGFLGGTDGDGDGLAELP
jgi:hypothetical protein